MDVTLGPDFDGERRGAGDGAALSRRELLAAAAAGTPAAAAARSVGAGSGERLGGASASEAVPSHRDASDATPAHRDGDAPAIRVPDRTAVGEPLRIRLAGFAPDTAVAVEASATDARGVEFVGTWTRRTDAEGTAAVTGSATDATETTTEPPKRNPENARRNTNDSKATTEVSRTTPRWTGTGPGFDDSESAGIEMLLRRLRPVADADGSASATPANPTPANFVVGERATVDVRLTARVGGDRRATATTTRVYADPRVSRRRVEDAGLVGWLYRPPGEGPHAGVLTLHGSHAQIPHLLSRALATHGYATLALRYIGAEGLPESVDDVPVEYFRRGTEWLTDRDDVRTDAAGFVGVSRGVEAALLAAAEFSGRAAAVGYSGGGVLAPGTNRATTAFEGWEAAWTRDGDPLADADAVRPVFTAARAVGWGVCETTDCVLGRVRERVSAAALRRATIPVEEIDGPVLLLAGTDDATWPARELSALAVDRLDRRGHAHPYRLRTYDGAGHVFGLPYRSYAGEATGPNYGGSPAANAFAAANSWPVVLRYLRVGTTGDGEDSDGEDSEGDTGGSAAAASL